MTLRLAVVVFCPLANAALADSFNYLAQPADAKLAVSRALELDETLGEAHATRFLQMDL